MENQRPDKDKDKMQIEKWWNKSEKIKIVETQ